MATAKAAATAAAGGAEEKGGYRVGDVVFFTGPSRNVAAGHRVVNGNEGKVTDVVGIKNLPLVPKDKKISVLFPMNDTAVECLISELSRTAPPAGRAAALEMKEKIAQASRKKRRVS